jgi:hypothetical protein
MNLKRILKKENSFPLSLSCGPLPRPAFLLFSRSQRSQPGPPAFSPALARASGPTGPATPSPVGPTAPPLFFFLRQPLTGGARPSGPPPTFNPQLGCAPIMAADRYRPGPPLPRLQTPQSSAVKLPPSLNLFKRSFPLLNPFPILNSIKVAWPLMSMPAGSRLPSPPEPI